VDETNWHATLRTSGDGSLEGYSWNLFIVAKFKA
jgi:hypothetical protein